MVLLECFFFYQTSELSTKQASALKSSYSEPKKQKNVTITLTTSNAGNEWNALEASRGRHKNINVEERF